MVEALRKTVKENLQPGFEEGMQYGAIGYFVPHSIYPSGYHCDPKQPVPFIGIGNQKGHVGLYMFCLYVKNDNVEQFKQAWTETGKKLDMGAACVRLKKMDDIAFDVIAKTVAGISLDDFLSTYVEATPPSKRKKA